MSGTFTSPAIFDLKSAVSKWVMGAMPLVPAHNASQVAWVPIPTDDTSPMPVTTTRLLKPPPFLVRVRPADSSSDRRPQRCGRCASCAHECLREAHGTAGKLKKAQRQAA